MAAGIFLGNKVRLSLLRAEALREEVAIDVTARCLPHSEIIGPSQVRVQFQGRSYSGSQTEVIAVSAQYDGKVQTATEIAYHFPHDGWVAAVFVGPKMVEKRYCQVMSSEGRLHLSYYGIPGLHVGVNKVARPTRQELDSISEPKHLGIDVVAAGEPYRHILEAGEGTATHYWIQFAIPFTSLVPLRTTVVEYQFQ